MARGRWLVPLAAVAGVLLYRELRRGTLQRIAETRQLSRIGATLYDVWADLLFGDFYDRVAREVAAALPGGSLLDVGCGPGLLEVRLAKVAPNLVVTGVDIDPAMIERANKRLAAAGVVDRVRFQVGDVGALPFPDRQFDLVVSTLSLHHWPDPALGLAQIYRVLKPGGQARIYDLPDWVRLNIHGRVGGATLAQLAAESPFGGGVVQTFRWPDRIPSLRCLWLRRSETVG